MAPVGHRSEGSAGERSARGAAEGGDERKHRVERSRERFGVALYLSQQEAALKRGEQSQRELAHSGVVDEAVAPLLSRLERADQRMTALARMGARVACGRGVTAADVAAGQADAQVQPLAALAQAVLATVDRRG